MILMTNEFQMRQEVTGFKTSILELWSFRSPKNKISDTKMHTEKIGFFLPFVGFTWCCGYQNQELARHLDLLHQPNEVEEPN